MEVMKLKMFIFGLSLLFIVTAAPFLDSYDDHWETFKNLFQKEYSRTEDGARRLVFERNLQKILNHNINADFKKNSYRLGINKFTDWTPEEFSRLNQFKPLAKRTQKGSTFLVPSNASYPAEVDWRKKGLVTEVKDQGSCDAGWAFSATGSMEGQNKKKTGKLVSLSEQNLIDCSRITGNNGCEGGDYQNAFEYVAMNGGIDTEESYPFEAKEGTCRFNNETVGATVNGLIGFFPSDEQIILAAVASAGPISIRIQTSDSDMRHYSSGVLDPKNCSSADSYPAVLLVGYGTENGKDYWLIKNSWGKSWGEEGYLKLVRNGGNKCAVLTEFAYPTM